MLFNLLAEGEQAAKNPTLTYVVMGVLVAAIIALFVWQSISGKKKRKEAQEMVEKLRIGDRIKTIGGVCGFLVEINNDENTIVIETGSDDKKSYMKFDKGAIYQTGPANPGAPVKEEPKAEVKEETKEEVKAEPVFEEEKVEVKEDDKAVEVKIEEAPVEEAKEEVKEEKPASKKKSKSSK